MYGAVPPVGVVDIVPLLPLLQDTLVMVLVTARGVGCVIVTDDPAIQPIPSLTETEYTPIERLLMVDVD